MATRVCAQCSAIVLDADLCGECKKSTLLEGRYKLLHTVGSGSFGTTYRALRISDNKPVAVKEMLVRRADSLKALELFVAPRSLPQEFSEHYLAESRFSTTFGILFGGIGSSILGILGVFITFTQNVPLWVSLMVFGMASFFAVTGFLTAFKGLKSRKEKSNIWRNGIPHRGILRSITNSTYSENEKTPTATFTRTSMTGVATRDIGIVGPSKRS